MSNVIGHFCLWGDFEVDDVTNLLCIQPSQVFRKGEMLDGASSPAKGSSWDLHCPPETGQSMEEQIDVLLKILRPKADILRSLGSRFHADLNVVESGTSVLSLNRELIRELADLNLAVNCFCESDEVENGD
ncbi:MAG: DUF4279 domain-containing protein [Acidobacteriota bacterium]|nr:DUF4279 domain-containing protein [Acidobacteriota bacterium]